MSLFRTIRRLSIYSLFLLGAVKAIATLSHFEGQAFDMEGNHLYTEIYTIDSTEDRIDKVTTKFLDTDGVEIAHLDSVFSDNNPYVPSVFFNHQVKGIQHGITLIEKGIELFRGKKKPKKKALTHEKNMVGGHGFYFFILDRLEELIAGKVEKIQFLVPKKLMTLPFSIKAEPDTKDSNIINVTLSVDKLLLKPFVKDICLSIDRKSKSLVSYEGISGYLDTNKEQVNIKYSPLIRQSDQ